MPLALDDRLRRETPPHAVPPIGETDLDRIIKLIPVELVLVYSAAAPSITDVRWRFFAVVLFVAGTVLAPVILYLDGRSTGRPARWPQYVVRTLTFSACALAIAWPFECWISGDPLRWARSLIVLVIPFTGAVLLRERRNDEIY
jgi:hypothetical protein